MNNQKDVNDNLSEQFDIDPWQIQSSPRLSDEEYIPAVVDESQKIEKAIVQFNQVAAKTRQLKKAMLRAQIDIDQTRNTNLALIASAMSNVGSLTRIAEDTQNPRVYQVLGQWMKIIMDLNQQTIDLNSKQIKITKDATQSQDNLTVQGDLNVNVLTTAAITQMLYEQSKKQKAKKIQSSQIIDMETDDAVEANDTEDV